MKDKARLYIHTCTCTCTHTLAVAESAVESLDVVDWDETGPWLDSICKLRHRD